MLRRPKRIASIILAVLAGVVLSAAARAKEMAWSAVDIRARLDDKGALHVVETQTVLFDGDWNGGERTFRVFPGQSLQLASVTRIDPDGTRHPLTAGGLSAVDEFGWAGENVLRWRSRLPEDPPFSNKELIYELDYTISGVLVEVQQGKDYLLEPDFAFPDRKWPIRKLTVTLELDPAWKPQERFTGKWTGGPLEPGVGFVVRVPLQYTGPSSQAPAAAKGFATPAFRRGWLAALLLVIAGAYLVWRRREAALGRFEPLNDPATIDEAWLEKHLLSLSPEEVGALWDEKIGPPEVAAVLARLSAEKKLSTKAEGKKLAMRLLVPVSDLKGYDRDLVSALFFDNRKETDTDEIKSHYKSRGFDPASKIRADLQKKLDARGELQDKSPAPSRWLTVALLAGAVLCHAWAVVNDLQPFGEVIGLAITFGILYLAGLAFAWPLRKRVDHLNVRSLFLLIVPLLIAYFAWSGVRDATRTSVVIVTGRMLLRMAIVVSLFNMAKSRSGPRRIARRKELASARAFFRRELATPAPRLSDDWFPYVLAFGLTSEADKWFRAYGGASPAGVASGSRSSSSSSSGSGSSSSSSPSAGGGWSGGGGAFGSAGASGSWAVAAGALAAGVSAPSSSSSGGGGGGGGGGGSSGGGGGGGW